MQVENVLLSLLTIVILLICLVAACAVAYFVRVSRSTPAPKRNSNSDTILSKLQDEVTELSLSVEALRTSVKRLGSRTYMQDRREREAKQPDGGAPPPGASKAEKLRYYKMAGKIGADFARAQQQFEMPAEAPELTNNGE